MIVTIGSTYRQITCSLFIGTVLVIAGTVNAQSTTAKDSDIKSDESTKNAEQENDTDKKPKNTLDDLIRDLTGTKRGSAGATENPIDRLIRSMRDVQVEIEQRKTGKPTQKKQQDIVKQLEQLIKTAEQQRSSSQQARQSQQNKLRKPGNQQEKDQQDQKSQTGEAAGQNSKEEVKDSEERVGKAEKRAVDDAKQRVLVQEVWGHLPPTLRKKLLNVFSEKRLLKYDDLVRRYFESLTEKDSGRE